MNDAEKREKVIQGLERFINNYKRYITDWEPVTDALDLLREQEPRVMTLEEVEKTDEWMWAEYVSGYCGWQRPDEEDDYLNMIAWNDSTVDRKDYYGKTWRCWTARPTDEQRKAVKWGE